MPEVAWILIAVLSAGVVGGVLAVRYKQWCPSSYTRLGVPMHLPGEGPSPEEWAVMSLAEQEAWDTQAVDEVEEAEITAADARDAAGFLADQVRINAQYHP